MINDTQTKERDEVISSAQKWYERTLIPVVVFFNEQSQKYDVALATNDLTGKTVVAQFPTPTTCDGGEPGA